MSFNIKIKKLEPCFENKKNIVLKPKVFTTEEIKRMMNIIDAGEVIRNKFSSTEYASRNFCKQ